MFEIKMNARYILRGGGILLKKAYLEPYILLFSAAVCFLMTAGFIVSGENILSRYFPFSLPVIACVTTAAGCFFIFFFYAARLYFLSMLFYLCDKSFLPPSSLMKTKTVVKYCGCMLYVALIKLLWRALFYSPSALISFLFFRTLEEKGGMTAVVFFTLIAAFAALFVTGRAFYAFVCGRYILCELLFIRSPLQSIREIVRSSAVFSRQRPVSSALFYIRSRFFATVFGKCVGALSLKCIFFEEKIYKKGHRGKGFYQSIPRAF